MIDFDPLDDTRSHVTVTGYILHYSVTLVLARLSIPGRLAEVSLGVNLVSKLPRNMSSSLNTSILWTPDGPADGWFGIVTYEIYQAVYAIFLDPNTVTRVIDLEKINEDYPDQPAILIRLAQDYFKLNDPASTYQCAQRAHRLIVERAHQTDPKLAAWVQFLHTKVETHLQEQGDILELYTISL